MGIVTGFIAFAILWWLVLFTVLPWGSHPADAPQKGHASSAPAKPNLKLKFAITTAISALLWYLIKLAIDVDLFDINVV